MKCPAKGVVIDACSKRCPYKDRAGVCKHDELMSINDGAVTPADLVRVLGLDKAKLDEYLQVSVKRIQVALVVDKYFDHLGGSSPSLVNKQRDSSQTHALHQLFGVTESFLRDALDRERYDAWKLVSGTDVTFDEVMSLLSKTTSNASHIER